MTIVRILKMLEVELGWLSLGCAGHTLQLCVNSSLEMPVLSPVTNCYRTMSGYPCLEEYASSMCFKNTSTGHENRTASTCPRFKHAVEQYLLHD